MNSWRNAALLSVALSASLTGAATAQGGKCDINESSPFQVNSARIYMTKARQGKFKDEQRKQARDAVRVLTENGEKISNQVGRHYVLAQTLLWWTEQPGVSAVSRRGDVGYTSNSAGMIDLYAALDSSLSAVETAVPACKTDSEFVKYRRAPWGRLINAAGTMINEEALDSAEKLVKLASTVYPSSPLGFYYAAVIAQKRNDPNTARDAFKRVVDMTTTDVIAQDTTLKRIRQTALFNYAIILQNEAERLSGEEQKAALQRTAEPLRLYIAEFPTAENTPMAQTALARALGQAGDTAAVAAIYDDMMTNPSKYTDIQLFEAGTGAFRAGRRKDSAQLFESGLAKNPYYRDALFNLANAYLSTDQFDKMLPVARTLVSVDPNNPDNWRLMAGAYQGLSKQTKDTKLQKAYIDSVLHYLEKQKSIGVKVSFSQFRHDGAKHTLSGIVENLGAAAGNYVLKFEFLDASGKVVASESATVSVPAKSKKEFTVQVSQEGIASFRYSPIS